MYDSYPKARHHVLIIPRDPELVTVYDLEARHVGVLRELLAVGWAVAMEL